MSKILSRFYNFIFRYWKQFIVSLVLFIGVSVLRNLTPIFIGKITGALQVNNIDWAFELLSFLVLIIGFEIVLSGVAAQLSDHILFRAARDARMKVFDHIHKLDFAYHTEKSSGSLISLFKRGDGAFYNFHVFLHNVGFGTIMDFLLMAIFFAGLYFKLFIVSMAVLLCVLVFMVFVLRLHIKKRRLLNAEEDGATAIIVDNMISFDTVKYFSKERFESDKLAHRMSRLIKAGMEYALTFRYIEVIGGAISASGIIATFYIVLNDYATGIIGLDTFVTASAFATIFYPKLVSFIFNMREIAKNYEDISKYFSILDLKVKVKDKPVNLEVEKWEELDFTGGDRIRFKHVDFSYDRRTPVLKNFHLTIKPGESIALVGKSGAGKTTVTKLLMRFYDPDNGSIEINGIDISKITKSKLRERIGIVPQETVLFNDTIAYNIGYGKEGFNLEEVKKASEDANLAAFIATLPEGYDTMVGERGIKLSGGQKQRLGIARVFMENAPIIIFDEATSNLDSESEKLIQEAFWRLAKDKTTIIIAHRLSTIKKADRIIVMEEGKIVDEGTHEELTNKESGIYKYLWELQSKGEIEQD